MGQEGGMDPMNQARRTLSLLGQMAEFPGATSHYSADLQKYKLVHRLRTKHPGFSRSLQPKTVYPVFPHTYIHIYKTVPWFGILKY